MKKTKVLILALSLFWAQGKIRASARMGFGFLRINWAFDRIGNSSTFIKGIRANIDLVIPAHPFFAPQKFIEENKKILEIYLSPVLPKEFDFFFKNQSSVKTLQDLCFSIDEKTLAQTGGRSPMDSLRRNQGFLQLVYLMEASLISALNLSKNKECESEIIEYADLLIIDEFKEINDRDAVFLYEHLLNYIKNKSQRSKAIIERRMRRVEKIISNALTASVQRIVEKRIHKSLSFVKRVERYFHILPQSMIEEKMKLRQERIEYLIEKTEGMTRKSN